MSCLVDERTEQHLDAPLRLELKVQGSSCMHHGIYFGLSKLEDVGEFSGWFREFRVRTRCISAMI